MIAWFLILLPSQFVHVGNMISLCITAQLRGLVDSHQDNWGSHLPQQQQNFATSTLGAQIIRDELTLLSHLCFRWHHLASSFLDRISRLHSSYSPPTAEAEFLPGPSSCLSKHNLQSFCQRCSRCPLPLSVNSKEAILLLGCEISLCFAPAAHDCRWWSERRKYFAGLSRCVLYSAHPGSPGDLASDVNNAATSTTWSQGWPTGSPTRKMEFELVFYFLCRQLGPRQQWCSQAEMFYSASQPCLM